MTQTLVKSDKIIDKELKEELLKFMKENIKGHSEKEYLEFIEIMDKVFEYPHLLTIYSSNDGQNDLDETILYSILKSKREENKIKKDENQVEEQSIQNKINKL